MQMKEEAIANPENELRSLLTTRKQIIATINKLAKRKKMLIKEPESQYFTHRSHEHIQENGVGESRKLVKKDLTKSESAGKVDNAKQVSHEAHGRKIQHHEKADENETEETKKMKEQLLQRNRRMFGGLSSYLIKAKTHIDAQKPKIEEKIKIHSKVHEKQKEVQEQLIKEELAKIEAEIQNAEKMKQHNSKQILNIQNYKLLVSYRKYSNNLKSFIFTSTEPSLSWQPGKQFDIAKELLGEKQKEIMEKNRMIEQSIKNHEEKFDYSIYLIENEQQFYKNMLDNYYHSLRAWQHTKTQPSLFWQPAKPYEQLMDSQLRPNVEMEKKLRETQEKSNEFYSKQLSRVSKQNQKPSKVLDEESESNSPFHYVKQESQ